MKYFISSLKILGIHLIMCVVPFIFVSVLGTDPRYTIDTPKSAGQIIGFAIYFLIFFAVYFLLGRKVTQDVNIKSAFSVIIPALIIAFYGIFMYFYVIVAQRLELNFMAFFAMPQLMVKKAITDSVVGNKVFASFVMILPAILTTVGFISKRNKS